MSDERPARVIIEDALRRLTDGTLTFILDEGETTIVAGCSIDGRLYSESWTKTGLHLDTGYADRGVKSLLRKMTAAKGADHDG